MRGGLWRVVGPLAGIAAVAIALLVVGSTNGFSGHGAAAHPPPRASVSAASSTRPRGGASSSARPAHIAVIVMENESYGDVVGSPAAPFITNLAQRYAVARQMYAVSHPSLPNYLALTGGSTFGITSDCTGCSVSTTSLVNQLQTAHISWKAYMEGLPRPCFTGAGAGEYAKKHDPFVYYTSVVRNRALCNHVVPLTELAAEESAGTLPRFIWITPNLCDDMHDCGVSTGDSFLSRLVPPLLAALGQNGILFVTWDEGTNDAGCCSAAGGGHVATIVAGPGAMPGARLTTPSDHYSVLQTIEDLLGLPRLRRARCSCTPSLKPLLAVG